MPLYSYACNNCGHQWEESRKYEDRDYPLSEPCPECEEENEIYRTYRMNIADSGRAVVKNLSTDDKSVLNGIKKANRGSTMPDY